MKNKLVIKIFNGPKMGHFVSTAQDFTADIEVVLAALLKLFAKAKLNSDKTYLCVRLRRDGESHRFIDGLFFDGRETYGYLGFLRGDMSVEDFDGWTAHSLNIVELFRVHESEDPAAFLGADILPQFPNMPRPPIDCVWAGPAGSPIEVPVNNADESAGSSNPRAAWEAGRN